MINDIAQMAKSDRAIWDEVRLVVLNRIPTGFQPDSNPPRGNN